MTTQMIETRENITELVLYVQNGILVTFFLVLAIVSRIPWYTVAEVVKRYITPTSFFA